MTPEQAKQLLPVIAAFADGKRVEYLSMFGWHSVTAPSFHSSMEWRVAPEPQPKRYRPLTLDEWREMFIRGRIVIARDGGLYEMHTVSANAICINMLGRVEPHELFEKCTFADGTPCGVETTA